MNVNDVETKEEKVECRLEAIFNKQKSLMEKYHPIESGNGFWLPEGGDVVDIHDRRGQARIKDFAWRFVEEITEATEAKSIHPDIPEHYQEELSDALHFLVELIIISGMSEEILSKTKDIPTPSRLTKDRLDRIADVSQYYSEKVRMIQIYRCIEQLGKAMNCLKNKPWKQSHMLTDVNKFKGNLYLTFARFIEILVNSGMDSDDIYNMYVKKNEVNKFRQRSKY